MNEEAPDKRLCQHCWLYVDDGHICGYWSWSDVPTIYIEVVLRVPEGEGEGWLN